MFAGDFDFSPYPDAGRPQLRVVSNFLGPRLVIDQGTCNKPDARAFRDDVEQCRAPELPGIVPPAK